MTNLGRRAMRLARVDFEGTARFGAVEHTVVRLLDVAVTPQALFGLEAHQLFELVQRSTVEVPVDEAVLLAPTPTPSKIVCVGLNYRDHANEAGQSLPDRPLLFSKPPSAIVGPGDEISWPDDVTAQVDWEAELAVVVGGELHGQDATECMKRVFGYTIANDITARDLQFSDGQWFRGKSLDTFCPVGPYIVTADEFGDPQQKGISSSVNDTLMQDASTSDMIFPVDFLLSWISRQIRLVPGDLVLTGTPPGVGAFRTPPRYLTAGDVVEVAVDAIGALRNPVGTR
jgi:2-keto-4-pentenoate hydratase/2-oxohepta-3-ene-1,7-dioic acid hydratase in catechol pathway